MKSLRSDGVLWHANEPLPANVNDLIISHLVNPTHAGGESDFYFGDLPVQLAKKGRSVVVLLVNHTDVSGQYLVDQWKKSDPQRIVLSKRIGIKGEIGIRRRLKREAKALNRLASDAQQDLPRLVLERASLEVLSGATMSNLRRSIQIETLAKILKPDSVTVTHEGHAWERLAFAAVRRSNSNAKCFGYAHGAIFKFQHAIRRNLASEYNPDHILTSGFVARDQLSRSPSLAGVGVSVLGSPRQLTNIKVNADPSFKERPACLVVPDGLPSECRLLFEFSLDCARKMPSVDFIWRLHPAIEFKTVFALSAKLQNLPANIILSRRDMNADISASTWVLYRGSTAVVQGATNGLRPVYLSVAGELTIDPLYELEALKPTVFDSAELEDVLTHDLQASNKAEDENIRKIADYAGRFYSHLNADAFFELL